jgi:hypothetical protein
MAATRVCISGSASPPAYQDADPPDKIVLLRSRRKRPRDCRPADKRDELAPM